MISYLIKSGLCLALLLAFYYLILEREKMHQFNRFYLLGSVLCSFLVPALIIYVEATPVVSEVPVSQLSNAEAISSPKSLVLNTPVILEEPINYLTYLLWIYIGITSLFFIRFVKSLRAIILKIRNNAKVSFANAKVVLVKESILPYTFLNYIFIHKASFEANEIENELLTHELTHVTQKHTLDVLFIEILHILFWINPFVFLLKKAIQSNHEFLADDKVIASHQDIPKYQYLLLDKAAWKNNYYLASNLNYSLTKKRLLMMKKSNSKVNILLKKLAIVPLVAGLVFLFANRVEAQTQSKKLPTKVNQKAKEETASNGATKKQLKEYETLVAYYQKHINEEFSIKRLKDMSRIKHIHDLMSSAQKKNATSYPQAPPSLSIFITNNGQYLIDHKEVSLNDIASLIQNFSENELQKSFVFLGKDDTKRYKAYYKPLRKSTQTKIRSLDETYINIYSDENLQMNEVSKKMMVNLRKDHPKARLVQHAFDNPKLTSYTIALAKVLEQNGIENIDY